MVIRAAMVEFVLRQKGFDVTLQGDSDSVVNDAREAWRQARGSGAFPIEAAYDAMLALTAWESALKSALLEGMALDDFMTLGADMLKRPIAYFDHNLITLASSAGYWKRKGLDEDVLAGPLIKGQLPPELAVDLMEDTEYLRAAAQHGGFYYRSAQHRMFYGINTFDGEKYLARLVITLAEGEERLHRGEEQLIDVYHAYLDDLYLHYAGNTQIASSQNDSLHVLVRTELTGVDSRLRDEADVVLESFGWSSDDSFLVVKLVFFEGVHWDTASLYLCGLLERTVSGSCAFTEERQIAWMINLERAARSGESRKQLNDRITASLVAVLRNYACKAGLSSVFSPFASARGYYLEASRAIEVGQIRDQHYWYYRFGDYALDYALSRCVDELSAIQVCHPALAGLLDHDAREGTEYARTLVCFLRKSQNTTHAAAELYLHRTSFMRRIGRIHELVDVNLEDPDEVLHLLLSAKLLGL